MLADRAVDLVDIQARLRSTATILAEFRPLLFTLFDSLGTSWERVENSMIGVVDDLAVPPQEALRHADDTTRWCVWAPQHERVRLILWQNGQRIAKAMQRCDGGHFRWEEPSCVEGLRYAYQVGNDPRELPDPASRWQPDGVNRPSALFDPSQFAWSDGG